MKVEVALQQVLGHRDKAYVSKSEDGMYFDSDTEGMGELKRRMDDLWEAWRHDADKNALRRRSKELTAAGLQFMTDCC
jgi:hypothetical protein